MLWGAAWLRRASYDDNYLKYLQNNGKTLGADENINEFGWDNKHAGLNVLVSKVSVNLPCAASCGYANIFNFMIRISLLNVVNDFDNDLIIVIGSCRRKHVLTPIIQNISR